jgi:hypothetical protein
LLETGGSSDASVLDDFRALREFEDAKAVFGGPKTMSPGAAETSKQMHENE